MLLGVVFAVAASGLLRRAVLAACEALSTRALEGTGRTRGPSGKNPASNASVCHVTWLQAFRRPSHRPEEVTVHCSPAVPPKYTWKCRRSQRFHLRVRPEGMGGGDRLTPGRPRSQPRGQKYSRGGAHPIAGDGRLDGVVTCRDSPSTGTQRPVSSHRHDECWPATGVTGTASPHPRVHAHVSTPAKVHARESRLRRSPWGRLPRGSRTHSDGRSLSPANGRSDTGYCGGGLEDIRLRDISQRQNGHDVRFLSPEGPVEGQLADGGQNRGRLGLGQGAGADGPGMQFPIGSRAQGAVQVTGRWLQVRGGTEPHAWLKGNASVT